MSNEKYLPGEEMFDPYTLSTIFRIASDRAVGYAQRRPYFAGKFLHTLSEEEIAARRAELQQQYLAAAETLDSNRLSPRQREVARLLVGTVVILPREHTASELCTTFGTRFDTLYCAVSTLISRPSHYVPLGLRHEIRQPLIAESSSGPLREAKYEPSPALEWLTEEPGRSPIIDQSIAEAKELFGASDSL